MSELSDLRKSYQKNTLDTVEADPFEQFKLWFDQALTSQEPEPNAMTLSTVSPDGQPSARTVLLKGIEPKGFVLYTNYLSHKGRDIECNPKVALLFFWPTLERQVRIQGWAEKTSREQSESYFYSRPRASQIGAAISPQSKAITSRAVLEKAQTEMENLAEIPCPEHWGGYLIHPQSFEFWQGRPGRLHDRIKYTRQGDQWMTERLAP